MGFEPGLELDELVDEPGFLGNFLNNDKKDNFCSNHKAVIPIARIRVLLDKDYVGDTISFKCSECSECSKCMTSKKSQRSNAVHVIHIQNNKSHPEL